MIIGQPLNSVVLFAIQVALNVYFIRLAFSYERELRLHAGVQAESASEAPPMPLEEVAQPP